MRSYFYRSAIGMSVRPIDDLEVTLTDGTVFSIPWIATYTSGLGNVTFCEAVPSVSSVESSPSKSLANSVGMTNAVAGRDGIPLNNQELHEIHHPHLLSPKAPFAQNVLTDDRDDREVIIATDEAEFEVSCFIQTSEGSEAEKAGVSRTLVMQVTSFNPPGEFQDASAGFLGDAGKCLNQTSYDLVVINVMQNGGGYVCLGLRLLQLIIEDYNVDPTLTQMNYDLPHSPLMDKYIQAVNSPDPDPVPDENGGIIDKSTGKAFPDGKAYYYPGRNVTQGGQTSWRTNYFSLNCDAAGDLPALDFKPSKFMSPDRLLLVTDGTCGSTCACFTKIPQEHNKATLIGIGGDALDSGIDDVSSFAGGFLSNADEMAGIANQTGIGDFPFFLTNQRWQFNWGVWYSEKFPTRPAQFTSQSPNYNIKFWGFPHPSISPDVTTSMVSELYDDIITNAIERLADDNVVPPSPPSPSPPTPSPPTNDENDDEVVLQKGTFITVLVMTCVLGVSTLLMGVHIVRPETFTFGRNNDKPLLQFTDELTKDTMGPL